MAWLAGRFNNLLDSMDSAVGSAAEDVKATVTGNSPSKESTAPDRYVSRRERLAHAELEEESVESPSAFDRSDSMYNGDGGDDGSIYDVEVRSETPMSPDIDYVRYVGRACRVQAGGGTWLSGTIIEVDGILATVDLGDGETDMLELDTPDIELVDESPTASAASTAPAAAASAAMPSAEAPDAAAEKDSDAARAARSAAFAAEIFAAADKNRDGELTHSELRKYLKTHRDVKDRVLGATFEWQRIFGEIEMDGPAATGTVAVEGQARAFTERGFTRFVQKRDFAEDIFTAADKNENGALTHSELRKYLQQHHAHKLKLLGAVFEWQQIFAEMGTKERGQFDREEFSAFVLTHDVRLCLAARHASVADARVPALATAADDTDGDAHHEVVGAATVFEEGEQFTAAAALVTEGCEPDAHVVRSPSPSIVAPHTSASSAAELAVAPAVCTRCASSTAALETLRAANGKLRLSKDALSSTISALRGDMERCAAQSDLLAKTNAQLAGKRNALESELNELDERMVVMQLRAETAEARAAGAGQTEEAAAARETQLLQRLHKLETANKLLGTDVADLQAECDSVGDEHAAAAAKAERCEEELLSLGEKCDCLEAELSALQTLSAGVSESSAQSESRLSELSSAAESAGAKVKSLEAQLVALQQSANAADDEHRRSLKEREQRVRDLERAKADLGETLARTRRKYEREAEEADRSVASNTATVEELHHLRNDAEALNAALDSERSRCSTLREEIRAVRQSAADRVAAVEADAAESARALAASKVESEVLLATARARAASKREAEESDAEVAQRMANLSEALVATQSQLEVAKTERSAYRNKVAGLTRRLQRATAAAMDSDGFLESGDLAPSFEDVGGVESNSATAVPGSASKLRRRMGSSHAHSQRSGARRDPRNQMSRVLPIKHVKVKRTIDAIDRTTLETALLVTRNPTARLALVLYVLFLHTWVFVVLTSGVHSLGERDGTLSHERNFPIPMVSEHPLTGRMVHQASFEHPRLGEGPLPQPLVKLRLRKGAAASAATFAAAELPLDVASEGDGGGSYEDVYAGLAPSGKDPPSPQAEFNAYDGVLDGPYAG